MTGNWSISREEFNFEYHPDFCSGFLYLTTPNTGAALAQAGVLLYPEKPMKQIEDSLITGVLRESLQNVDIDQMNLSPMSFLWDKIFSQCPWLTLTKLSFFNDMVKSKQSSRSNVQYVGSITNLQVWRFFICLHLEFILENLEHFAAGLAPSFIFDICAR